jgi:hypothetical protein
MKPDGISIAIVDGGDSPRRRSSDRQASGRSRPHSAARGEVLVLIERRAAFTNTLMLARERPPFTRHRRSMTAALIGSGQDRDRERARWRQTARSAG